MTSRDPKAGTSRAMNEPTTVHVVPKSPVIPDNTSASKKQENMEVTPVGVLNPSAVRQQRQERVYSMMKGLQQKHLATMMPTEISSKENSELSEAQSICRICHCIGDEPLVTPCHCSGSAKHVHASCLVTWFKKAVKNTCELCRCKVAIKKRGKPFAEWRRPEDKPIPLIWFLVFLVGLFLNVFSIAVNASELCSSTACVIFYVVNGFGVILDAAFLYFWWTKCMFYWKKWCALNQEWSIVIATNATSNHRQNQGERSSTRTLQIPHIV